MVSRFKKLGALRLSFKYNFSYSNILALGAVAELLLCPSATEAD